jgi:hypothetical protein
VLDPGGQRRLGQKRFHVLLGIFDDQVRQSARSVLVADHDVAAREP